MRYLKGRMSSRPSAERRLTLRQADQTRADLYAIADELEFLKVQLATLPNRAYISRVALLATGSVWALMVALALIVMR